MIVMVVLDIMEIILTRASVISNISPLVVPSDSDVPFCRTV